MHIIKHFMTITSHRIKVMNMCFKCGLYWRGITHDLSKYSLTEFIEGAKYYVGIHSPISECRKLTGKVKLGYIIKEEIHITQNIG